MNEIKAYLLPSQNYQMINNNDLLELDKTVSSILEKDIALVPDEFYEVPDSNGISGTDYLFCNGQSDLNIFLLNIIERKCLKRWRLVNSTWLCYTDIIIY